MFKYPPIGRCIYCGATVYSSDSNRPLADEHIFSYALGGDRVLPEASCKACETITGTTEQIALRGALRGARVFLELPSRKGHPDYLPMYFHRHGEVGKIELAADDYPVFLLLWAPAWLPIVLTDFDMPDEPRGYVTGGPMNDAAAKMSDKIQPDKKIEFGERPPEKEFYREGMLTSASFDVRRFYGMMAKVAHAYAVAEVGIDNFKPYLLEIIKGEADDDLGLYIGGPMVQTRSFEKGKILIASLHFEYSFEGPCYVVARLVPFANLGGPTVFIVVGEILMEKLTDKHQNWIREESLSRRF